MAIPLAFTSDNTARFTGDFTSINPGGFGSNWCGSSFVVSGRFDLTAMANLKVSWPIQRRAVALSEPPPFVFSILRSAGLAIFKTACSLGQQHG